MTPYTMLHLALAGAFFVLALMHFATWAAVRSQRVQLWLASSFLGFAVLSLAAGLTSHDASELNADARFWIILGVLPSIPLPFTLLRVAWSLLDVPLTLFRRAMLAVALALGVVRVLDVVWSVLRLPETGLTPEALSDATKGLSLLLFWLLATCVAGTWAVEAALLLKRRGVMAAAVLAAAVFSLALLGREFAIDAGWLSGPPLFVLVGLPFLMLASTSLAILTARSLRGADLGTGIHRYRRLLQLGRGGMGEVWLAVRTGRAGFHRLVVLKRMLKEGDSDDPEIQVQRFIGEARTSARLHHPNIISVHDLGQIDGAWFIVMEYLSGVNVYELVKRVASGSTLPLEVIVEISQQALRGLAYAHEHGVIHRDISADNLVVSFDGVVKVVDFGIAHRSGEAQERVATRPILPAASSDNRLTQAGLIIGKAGYMPPERLEGADATVSGDLFALGCVIYELLTGELPEVSVDDVQLPRLERSGPPAYQLLKGVLEAALHPDANRRFPDARAFQLGLEPVRKALPPVELATWLRENFADRWTRERKLLELSDPTPADVEALRTHEPTTMPAGSAETTQLVEPKGAKPLAEQSTRILPRSPGNPGR